MLVEMWRIYQGLTSNDHDIEFFNGSARIGIAKNHIFCGPEGDRAAFKKSFVAKAPQLWNLMPDELKQIEHLHTFKAHLRSYLRRTYPDRPPLKGFDAKNDNSLLAWAKEINGLQTSHALLPVMSGNS